MAGVRNIRNNKRYKNFISSLVALNKTGEALESFTENGLKVVHQQITQKLGNMQACTRQCSAVFRQCNRWCHTCLQWKTELEKWIPHGTARGINWSRLHSWTWINHARAIAEVFILPGWDTNNINLKDLSTVLMIWHRCSRFTRQLVALSDHLRDDRNELAHNHIMSITTRRKTAIFNNIRNIINQQDVRPSIPTLPDVLQFLQELEQGDLFHYENDIINALQIIAEQNENIKTKIDRLALGLTEQHNALRDLARKVTVFTIGFVFVCLLIFIPKEPSCSLIFSNPDVYLASHHHQLPIISANSSFEGCLSESTVYVPLGNVSLFAYLSHHKILTGRKWLFPILRQELFNKDRHGLLLEASMGYGKSALMAHIICANNRSIYSEIRKQLVAFHVCRFDVSVSKQVSIFAFRLLEMISRRVTELNDTIRACHQLFDRASCEEDPNGCLDYCVIFPLNKIHYKTEKPLVIALDALDECYDPYRNENPIFLLLKRRINWFPLWIKFFITSRFDSDIQQLVKDLALIQLEDDDEKNKNDILYYFKEYSPNMSALHISHDTNNFLIATSLNENNIDNSTGPKTLDRYYDEQFTREFGEGARSDFNTARCILEVLCSLFQAPEEHLILNIVAYSTSYTETVLHETLQRLHNFLRIIDGKYHLRHLSLKQWLINTNNRQFNLNINNGQKISARYFLSKILNDSASLNIVDLCIHVGLSIDTQLKEDFLNLSNNKPAILEHSEAEYPVIELAKRIDSVEIMNLLTSLYKDIDRKDNNTMTATFVAASHGHLESMKALLNKGADITVRTDSFKHIINLDIAFEVSFEYQYWGYGILDIAAQNGHTNIVEFILSNNGKLFDYPMSKLNSMMLLPIHLACKRGNLEIVKQLSTKFPWMLDWQCLYYASEIGHIALVEFILDKNINDECRPCKQHLHWIPKDSVRVQGQIVPRNTSNENFVLFDDWLNITCESALHVAVRRERSEIVKLLVKQNTNALHCYDRGGRTPVISAVQYGHQDIVDIFLLEGFLNYSETCSKGIALNDLFKLHKNEKELLQDYFCEEGMPLLQVATKFDRYSVFQKLTTFNQTLRLDQRNLEGCHVIHQAACYSRMKLLFYFESLNLFDKHLESFYKCQNGSSPLQSAIMCGSVAATEFLMKYSNFDGLSIDSKFSYLLLAVDGDLNADLVEDVTELEKNITLISKMLITEDEILLHKDKMGRTIFHYAIRNGHFGVLSYLFSRYFFISLDCLISKDKSRKKPLQFAIDSIQQKHEFIINITTLFGFHSNDSFATIKEVASPKEYSIIIALNFLNKFRKMDSSINQDTLKKLIKKQCINVIFYILVKSKTAIFENSILGDILKHDKNGIIMLSYYLVFITKYFEVYRLESTKETLNLHYSRTCRTCDEVLNECRLHTIALTYSVISNVISALKLEPLHGLILPELFRQSDVYEMSTCYDKDGFNVLERAIQSGSHFLIRHLFSLKVESDLEKENLVEMGLNSLKYRTDADKFVYIQFSKKGNIVIHFMTYSDLIKEMGFTKDFHKSSLIYINFLSRTDLIFFSHYLTQSRNESDVHIYHIIKEYQTDLPRSKICMKPITRRFSLVHRLAFEGYTKSLMLVQQRWGNDVLNCRNLDGFTPLYLTMVLNFTDTSVYLEGQGLHLSYPSEQAEYYLLSNIVYRFIFSRKEFLCLTKKQPVNINSIYGQIKLYKCLQNVFRTFDSSSMSKSLHLGYFYFKWLKAFFSLSTEASVWQTAVNMIVPRSHYILYPYVKSRYLLSMKQMNLKGKTHLLARNSAYWLALFDLETKTCKYLKRSTLKGLSLLLEYVEGSKMCISCFKMIKHLFNLKSSSLNDQINDLRSTLEEQLFEMINDDWDFQSCSDVIDDLRSDLATFYNNLALKSANKCVKNLKLEVMLRALKESAYFPFASRKLSTRRPDDMIALFRLYRRYDYINVLYFSKTYQGSVAYMCNNLNAYTYFTSGMLKAAQFKFFETNTAKLLKQYLDSISD